MLQKGATYASSIPQFNKGLWVAGRLTLLDGSTIDGHLNVNRGSYVFFLYEGKWRKLAEARMDKLGKNQWKMV